MYKYVVCAVNYDLDKKAKYTFNTDDELMAYITDFLASNGCPINTTMPLHTMMDMILKVSEHSNGNGWDILYIATRVD